MPRGKNEEDCGSTSRLWRRKADEWVCDTIKARVKESDERSLESSGILGDLAWFGVRVLSLVLQREGNEEGMEIEWTSTSTSRRVSMRRTGWMLDLAAGLFPFAEVIVVVCVESEWYFRGTEQQGGRIMGEEDVLAYAIMVDLPPNKKKEKKRVDWLSKLMERREWRQRV